MASQTPSAEHAYGTWLRSLREARSLPQRELAAAARMDSSHYGKVETGKRYLTPDQAAAIAPLLGLRPADLLARQIAARVLAECGGDHALAQATASHVQEAAAPYLVNKPANNRANKK